jgi:hypothetical protein
MAYIPYFNMTTSYDTLEELSDDTLLSRVSVY